jgi:glucokinase
MVAPAVEPPVVIGLDVGGTKIRSGLVDREGNVLEEREVPSPGTSEQEVLAALDAAVEGLLSDRVAAIGYGIPANIERGTGRVLWATNLPLTDVVLDDEVSDLGPATERAPVDHDAAPDAGAEREHEEVGPPFPRTQLPLGQCGGTRVVLDPDRQPESFERPGGRECTCGGRGHLEVLASGSAADVAARALYGEGADAHTLVGRAQEGDEPAREALARIGGTLGAAIGSLVNVFAPELVVVGGGFGAAAGPLVLDPARESARRESIYPADGLLEVVPAELGEEAGLVGAGLVGFEALDGER